MQRKKSPNASNVISNTGSAGVSLQAPGDPAGFDFGSKTQTTELGSSGTDVIGGFYREEFLPDLQGQKAAKAYDQMRRREAVVAMLLDAIKNPISSGNWTFEIDDEQDPMQLKMKRLCEYNFFGAGLDEGWDQLLSEISTFIDFGHAVFEVSHVTKNIPELADWDKPDPTPEVDDEEDQEPSGEPAGGLVPAPKKLDEPKTAAGQDGGELDNAGPLVTCFAKIAFRKQESIYRWFLERKTGKLISIQQITMGDVSKQTIVDIPGEFCLVFTNKKEGDNLEGISALRPMYGSYLRKDLYLRLAAMGAEKNAVGTVIGTTPATKANTTEDAKFEEVLEAYAGNESSYIKIPEGWKVEIQYGEFDPAKMALLLNFENEEMCKAVIANFLNLGTGGNSGSLAVGGTLSNFFLNGIQAYANNICGTLNRKAIPSLCELNFGKQKKYPKLKCTGINDKAGLDLAQIILALVQAKALKPDDKLEDFLRSQYKLTKADPATARELTPPPMDPNNPNADPAAGGATKQPPGKKNGPSPSADKGKDKPSKAIKAAEIAIRNIQFADKYRSQFAANKLKTKALMQKHLTEIKDGLLEQIKTNWNKTSEATRLDAGKGVAARQVDVSAYKSDLRDLMATVATMAITQARSELPAAGRKIAFGAYDSLNPIVKRAIESQLRVVVDSQVSDLGKVVGFAFHAAASTRTDIDAVLLEIGDKVDSVEENGNAAGMNLDAAAGDATAQVTQNSRNALFFDEDVLATIESFTFTNEDPITEICQNLNGQTFSASDPDAEQFYPPLHHNCKSRLVPNGADDGVGITGIAINAGSTEERASLEKQITLSCGCLR